MTDDGIHVEGLARSFGEVHAVRDMTFTARPGRVTALVGPNGSGKTTLLLILATLLAPDRGTVRIGGLDPVADAAGVRALMGWMPDVLGIWPSLTVRDALRTTGRLMGLDAATAAQRAGELLTTVDLVPLADRPARVLSRGQKQRLSLARALVHEPRVLLLDEPASGLDPQARVDQRQLLRKLADEGRTVLVSSHVLSELDELADDAVFVRQGETVSVDDVDAAKQRARIWRVASLDPAALRTALGAEGRSPLALKADDRALGVTVTGGDEEAAALLARLVGAGVPISAFTPAVGELESTLLDLGTGEAGA